MLVKSSYTICYRDPDVNGVNCIAFVYYLLQNCADEQTRHQNLSLGGRRLQFKYYWFSSNLACLHDPLWLERLCHFFGVHDDVMNYVVQVG